MRDKNRIFNSMDGSNRSEMYVMLSLAVIYDTKNEA